MQQPETYHTRPHPRARHRETSLHVGGWSVAISWASVGVVACAVVSACLSICQGALSWSACRHASTAISQMRCTCCNTAVKALARTIRGALVHPESGFVFRPQSWARNFLIFLENKLSKSDFLTGRKNSILIPTRNADGMWASIMSLQETWFLWDTQLRQLWKAARGPHATEILASHVHHQATHVLEAAR